jgi:integrase
VLAKKRAGEVADARDPVAEDKMKQFEKEKEKLAAKNTVNAILNIFVARHVKQLRSGYQVERAFDVYVRPRIGKTAIYDLRRRDIVEMLDAIEDENGPVMADRVLAHLRKAFNWHAARDDQFSPPIVRGMARTKPAERARTRALSDDEIGTLWQALNSNEISLPLPRRIGGAWPPRAGTARHSRIIGRLVKGIATHDGTANGRVGSGRPATSKEARGKRSWPFALPCVAATSA